MSLKTDVPALSIQLAGSSTNKHAELHTLPRSTAPADIAAALPGFLPVIVEAVQSRSLNTAAVVRDKVKRSRRTDDDGLLTLALEEYNHFHLSGGDVHLAEQSQWMLVWLRTRAGSVPIEMSHYSALIDILISREKFAALGSLLRRLMHRVEMKYGELSSEYFALLQQLLEIQFWAGDVKEVDMLTTHLGRLRDKYPLDHEHFICKSVEAGMTLVLKQEWSRVLVEMHKAAKNLNRLRSNLKSVHTVAQIDAQNAAVGGADASREEAIERDLQARMDQIDVYLCTANMLYAKSSVEYSGKESLPSVQQQHWFAASYELARNTLGANARITLSIRFSHAQWLMDRKMFAQAATICEDIAIEMVSTYSSISFIHDVRLVHALRSLSRCFMHIYDVPSSITVIDVAIELCVRLFGDNDPRYMQLLVDKADIILSKALLTTKDLDQVQADLSLVHNSITGILHQIQLDLQRERESRVFDPNRADRPAIYLSSAEIEAKGNAVRSMIFTTPQLPADIASAAEAQAKAAPKVNGKLKAVPTSADAWCDIVSFTSVAANDDILGFALQTIRINIRSDLSAFQYLCNNCLARTCRTLGMYFIKKLHHNIHISQVDDGKSSVKLAMKYLRQYMDLMNQNYSFDTPSGVVQGLQSLARIVYTNAELLGGIAEASKGAEMALKVCIRCLVRFESEGNQSLALDIQQVQAMAINVRNGVDFMEVLHGAHEYAYLLHQ
jgi:hypothetical protein